MIKIAHFTLELSTLCLLHPDQLVNFFLLFFVELVQIDLSHRIKGDGRRYLLLQEVFISIFTKPRVGKDLLYSVDGAQSLLGILTEQPSQ